MRSKVIDDDNLDKVQVFKISMLIRKFVKSEFIRNVATMLSGNILAQVVALLSAPIITRLYAPAHFGVMTFILANASIFTVIACFRYRYAIVIPADDKKGYDLIHISLLAIMITTFILFFGIMILKNNLPEMSNLRQYEAFLFFIPVIVFLSCGREIAILFHTRLKNFKLISFSNVLMTLIISGFKIGAGIFISASVFWLLFSNIIGILISGLVLVVFMKKFYIYPGFSKIRLNETIQTAKEYIKFPKFNLPTAFLNTISQNLPVFMFSYFFSQEIVGFYGLANMVVRRPVAVMSQSFSNVFLQKIAETYKKKGDLYANLKKATLGLVVIGAVPFSFLMLTGKWLFGFIFGPEWSEAGMYAQILAPWLFLVFITPPANQIYSILLELEFKLFWNILNITLNTIAIVLGYMFFKEPFGSILFFSISSVSTYCFFILYAFKLVNKTQKKNA